VTGTTEVRGRLVLEDRVADGRITVSDGVIGAVDLEATTDTSGPIVTPGFVDLHVHGWGGHDAMGDRKALDGLARGLLQRGVTSFLPTAVSAPLDDLAAFAARVRAWRPDAPADGADPLGANLEGPFLAPDRRGAHAATHLRSPADVPTSTLEPLVDGLRLITIAPELPGALEAIAWWAARGVAVSLGHSAADVDTARRGYAAGASSTTHLFNAMTGLDHRNPGLALAALLDPTVAVELIADGHHVQVPILRLVHALKDRRSVTLVSDSVAPCGLPPGRYSFADAPVDLRDGRVTLPDGTLAGSALTLDRAVALHVKELGLPLEEAIRLASENPARLVGEKRRGEIRPGFRADLVHLDDRLRPRRTWVAGELAWPEPAAG
jgi:N-acetylglucosamine-6-phosphate deacetylase